MKRKHPVELSCRHVWKIDADLQGVCGVCGEKKDFYKKQVEAGIIMPLREGEISLRKRRSN